MRDEIGYWLDYWLDGLFSWIFIDMWVITYPGIVFFFLLSAAERRTDSARNDLPTAWLFLWGFIYLVWFTNWLVDIRKALVG